MASKSVGLLMVALALVLISSYGIDAKDHKSHESKKAGGTSDEKSADENVKKLVKKLRSEIKSKIEKVASKRGLNILPGKIEALEFKQQVVSGTNYYVRLRVTDQKDKSTIWHARIYEQTWTNTLEVSEVSGPKGKHEAL